MRLALIGLAGAAGALARYGIGQAIGPRTFPWATLGINVAGSLVLGFVLGGPGVGRWSTTVTTTVAVGFLGAFTTFSTFAFETTSLMRADRPVAAFCYVALSLAAGLAASAVGFVIGRGVA